MRLRRPFELLEACDYKVKLNSNFIGPTKNDTFVNKEELIEFFKSRENAVIVMLFSDIPTPK